MRITRGTDVGLRVLMRLARSDAPKVSINDLADDINLPERHVGKIVQVLAKYGWVATIRGRRGGVAITPAGLDASADMVLAAVEGDAPVLDCYDPPCPYLAEGCRLRDALCSAQDAFRAELAGRTIRDLAGADPWPALSSGPRRVAPGAEDESATIPDTPIPDDDASGASEQTDQHPSPRRPHRRVPAASGV